MKFFSFKFKILIPLIIIPLLCVAILVGYSTWKSNHVVEELVDSALTLGINSLQSFIAYHDEVTQARLNANLQFMMEQIANRGGIRVERDRVDSVTGLRLEDYELAGFNIPYVAVGGRSVVNQHWFTDYVTDNTGSVSTIFYFLEEEEKFLRITTSVRDLEGERAVGTYIESDSPVYQSIINGETFYGVAWVVDRWYLTAYEPLYFNNQLIGIAFVGEVRDTEDLVDVVINQRIGDGGYFYVLDYQGKVLLHPNPDLVGVDLSEHQFIQDMLSMKNGKLEYLWEGNNIIAEFRDYPNWEWIIASRVDLDDVTSVNREMASNMLLYGGLLVVLAIAIGYYLAMSVTKPINRLQKSIAELANGDFGNAITIKSNDEIGVLSNDSENMRTKLRTVLRDVQKNSEQNIDVVNEVTNLSNVNMQGIEKVKSNTDGIIDIVEQVVRNIKEINLTMNEVANGIDIVADNVNNITESSTQALQSANDGSNVVTKSVQAFETIQSSNDKTSSEINNLSLQLDSITEFVGAISGIAEQTNLLALNASIEAARAGDAGRGFAVVAEEVRKLAEEAGKASKEIQNTVSNISNVNKTVVENVKKNDASIREGRNSLTPVVDRFSDIKEQIQKVAHAIQELSALAEEMSASTEEVSATITDITSQAEQIPQELSDNMSVIAEQEQNTHELLEKVAEVQSASDKVMHSLKMFKL